MRSILDKKGQDRQVHQNRTSSGRYQGPNINIQELRGSKIHRTAQNSFVRRREKLETIRTQLSSWKGISLLASGALLSGIFLVRYLQTELQNTSNTGFGIDGVPKKVFESSSDNTGISLLWALPALAVAALAVAVWNVDMSFDISPVFETEDLVFEADIDVEEWKGKSCGRQ